MSGWFSLCARAIDICDRVLQRCIRENGQYIIYIHFKDDTCSRRRHEGDHVHIMVEGPSETIATKSCVAATYEQT